MNNKIDPRTAKLHDRIKIKQWRQIEQDRMAAALIRDNQARWSYPVSYPSNNGSTSPDLGYIPAHP